MFSVHRCSEEKCWGKYFLLRCFLSQLSLGLSSQQQMVTATSCSESLLCGAGAAGDSKQHDPHTSDPLGQALTTREERQHCSNICSKNTNCMLQGGCGVWETGAEAVAVERSPRCLLEPVACSTWGHVRGTSGFLLSSVFLTCPVRCGDCVSWGNRGRILTLAPEMVVKGGKAWSGLNRRSKRGGASSLLGADWLKLEQKVTQH